MGSWYLLSDFLEAEGREHLGWIKTWDSGSP